MRKKLVLFLIIAIAGIALVLVALPLWMPWLLPTLLRNYGVRYSTYSRKGYGGFALLDVKYADPEFAFQAGRVEALMPTAWLWRRAFHSEAAPFLRIENWDLRWKRTGATRFAWDSPEVSTVSSSSLASAIKEAQPDVQTLRRWVPRAEMLSGQVAFASRRISIPQLNWNDGHVSARVADAALASEGTINADLTRPTPWRAELKVEPQQLQLSVELTTKPASVGITGTLLWRSNHVSLAADFGRADWLPSQATVQADQLRIPARLLGIQGYQDLTGALAARWAGAQFQVDLTAQADPLRTNSTTAFPVQATIHAHGTTNLVRFEQVTIRAPFLQADLSPGTTVDFKGRLLSPEANFKISADLAKQGWVPALGQLEASALLVAGTNRLPNASVSVSGRDLEAFGVALTSANLQSALDWPWLQVSKADLHFKEGASAALLARVNLAERWITNGALHFEGKAGGALLPTNLTYQSANLQANFAGPLQDLHHDGAVQITGLMLEKSVPLQASVSWQGESNRIGDYRATLIGRDAVLLANGTATVAREVTHLSLKECSLRAADDLAYSLVAPSGLTLLGRPSAAAPSTSEWSLELEPFRWSGPGRSIILEGNLNWPRQGQFETAVTNFDAAVLNEFLQTPLPAIHIDALHATGGWSNGPVHLVLAFAGDYTTQDQFPILARVEAEDAGRDLVIKKFQIATRAATVVSGSGHLPVWLDMAQPGSVFRVDTEQPLELHAITGASPKFWDEVSRSIQVALVEPRARLDVTGPLSAPRGEITVEVAAIRPLALTTNRPIPQLTALTAEVQLDRAAARLDRFRLSVDGQPVEATGQVPIGGDFSSNWRRFFRWQEATGAVHMVNAPVASYARYAPQWLSPQGSLNVAIALRPDLQFDGSVRLEHAATRPIAALGSVQDLEAQLRVRGRAVQFETFTGQIGGEPFSITGTVDFAHPDAATGLPRLNLHILGQNLPLAREPELIVRSDLNLSISNQTNGPTLVSGTAHLRDSVLLSDLRMMLPGKAAQPKQRPPYFSIDTEPFAEWKLNVHVQGEKFLKVRSPFFRGVVSTDLKLEGDLAQPMALGEATVNSGLVDLPFGTLEITQGQASFTSANPYRPQVFVAASSKALGYDVRMEVSGFADSPNIQFSSTPPLSSEQVLLMLTTGEVPQAENPVTAQQRASRLALFLGKSLLSEFTSGPDSADRLTIRSGEYMSEQGQQTYSLEYRLNKRWSLVGEYDRFGAYNAGVKWRVFSH
jgi:translocation and assembly module TamB